MANGVPRHSSSNIEDTVPEEPDEEDQQAREHERNQDTDRGQASATATLTETQPLMVLPPASRDYGAATTPASGPGVEQNKSRRTLVSRLVPFRIRTRKGPAAAPTLPINIVTEEAALNALSSKNKNGSTTLGEGDDKVEDTEGDYLKSKSW